MLYHYFEGRRENRGWDQAALWLAAGAGGVMVLPDLFVSCGWKSIPGATLRVAHRYWMDWLLISLGLLRALPYTFDRTPLFPLTGVSERSILLLSQSNHLSINAKDIDMGMIYTIGCQECGFYLELWQGVGMMFHDQERILSFLPEEEQAKVKELLSEEGAKLDGIQHEIYFCPACQLQESRLTYQVASAGGEIQRPAFDCSRCGGPLEEDDQFRRLEACPACGSTMLMEGTGDWD